MSIQTEQERQGACQKGFKTMCGGQALIEGIMMRGPKKQSVVVRRPDGELEIQEKDIKLIRDLSLIHISLAQCPWMTVPHGPQWMESPWR